MNPPTLRSLFQLLNAHEHLTDQDIAEKKFAMPIATLRACLEELERTQHMGRPLIRRVASHSDGSNSWGSVVPWSEIEARPSDFRLDLETRIDEFVANFASMSIQVIHPHVTSGMVWIGRRVAGSVYEIGSSVAAQGTWTFTQTFGRALPEAIQAATRKALEGWAADNEAALAPLFIEARKREASRTKPPT
jgi:hypothetical protein